MPGSDIATLQPLGKAKVSLAGAHWPLIQGIAIGALLLAGPLPLLVKFFEKLWSRPQYQFFPLMLLAAPWIGLQRLAQTPASGLRRGAAGLTCTLLIGAGVALLLGGALYLRVLGAVAALLILAAVVWHVGGPKLARAMLPAAILLLVLIPPPMGYEGMLSGRMRMLTVHASSRVLDALHVPNLVTGTVVEIPGDRLLVEEACSGINSLMSVLAFTLLYAFWQNRRVMSTIMLAGISVFFVLWANVLRIVIGAYLKARHGIDLLSGTAHESVGVILFIASLGLVLSADQVLLIFETKRQNRAAAAARHPVNSIVAPTPTIGGRFASGRINWPWWMIALAFAGIGLFLQARVGPAWPMSRPPAGAVFDPPATLAGWQRVQEDERIGRPEPEGQESRFWLYRNGSMTVAVAIDYPFQGYHPCTVCYAVSGWNLKSVDARRAIGPAAPAYYRVIMTKPPASTGFLLYGQFDEHGQWAQMPTAPTNQLESIFGPARYLALAPATYSVQVLEVGYRPLNAQQRTRVEQLFQSIGPELAHEAMRQIGIKP
jgi:exosortase